MTHGSLFSGIGGFDLAAEWMGWENSFWCEIDPFNQAVLRKNFNVSSEYGNIRETDFNVWRGRIDVLSGGDPCQPSSHAGLRRGKEDERYLWPEYKRAIKQARPKWIVNENVTGTITNGILDEKISDLESLQYSWWPPLIIPASALGYPHERERVWLVANSKREGLQGHHAQWENLCVNKRPPQSINSDADVFMGGARASRDIANIYEAIMGMPEDWTNIELDPSEMQLFLKSLSRYLK